MPSMFGESQTESLDEVELHDLNYFLQNENAQLQ